MISLCIYEILDQFQDRDVITKEMEPDIQRVALSSKWSDRYAVLEVLKTSDCVNKTYVHDLARKMRWIIRKREKRRLTG